MPLTFAGGVFAILKAPFCTVSTPISSDLRCAWSGGTTFAFLAAVASADMHL
jgi:hypothetical protein